jgi:hypothetical protein
LFLTAIEMNRGIGTILNRRGRPLLRRNAMPMLGYVYFTKSGFVAFISFPWRVVQTNSDETAAFIE